MDRPKIKDLVKKYGCKDFFLHSDSVLGTSVCLSANNEKHDRIIERIRKDGWLCIMADGPVYPYWYIKKRDEL